MGVCTMREDYRCHDDCEMSGCPGHQAVLEFSTTTEGYVWTPAPGAEPVYFDRSQAAALLSMMRQLSENRVDAAAYFPRGYVLVPVDSVKQCACGCGRYCCTHCGTELGGFAARPEAP